MDYRYSLIFVPLILSSLVQYLLPSDFSKTKTIFFQPPSYVFGIVWTILYILLGIYLYRFSTTFNYKSLLCVLMLILYVINITLNVSWTPVVNRIGQYKNGVYMIGTMILSTILLITLENDRYNKSLMAPYVVWLLYALLLNIELVRESI